MIRLLFSTSFLLLSFLCPLSKADGFSEPRVHGCGLIVSVTGDVLVHCKNGYQTAFIGCGLQMGDTIAVMMGGSCRGFTPGGQPFKIKGPAQVIFTRLSEDTEKGRIGLFVSRQLAQWVGESRRFPLVSRAGREWILTSDAPAPLIPAPDGRVRYSRQLFVWTMLDGVDRYEITIAPEDGKDAITTIRGHMIIKDDLEAGKNYVWKVRPAMKDFPATSKWQAFRVMTPKEENSLDTSLKDLPDLEAGVMLLAFGLHMEAISRFDAAMSSDEDRKASLIWRARAFRSIGLFEQAYEDIIEFHNR